jgi:hypothetical protein
MQTKTKLENMYHLDKVGLIVQYHNHDAIIRKMLYIQHTLVSDKGIS